MNQLRSNEAASLNETAQLLQVLAQQEANLLRKENQKVQEKSDNT